MDKTECLTKESVNKLLTLLKYHGYNKQCIAKLLYKSKKIPCKDSAGLGERVNRGEFHKDWIKEIINFTNKIDLEIGKQIRKLFPL